MWTVNWTRTHPAQLLTVALASTAVLGVLAPPAQAAAVQLRFVTFNVNFNNSQPQVRADWEDVVAPHADIVFFQEAKNVRLADFINTNIWLVRQNVANDAEAGSALAVRRSAITDFEGWDLVKGVDASNCPGDPDILTRWIAKMGVKVSNGRLVRIASLHMPPGNCQTGPGSPYDRMSDNIVQFVRGGDRLTVLGADWNKIVDQDPNDIGKRTGLEPNGPDDGSRIDGFMYSKQLANCCLTRLGQVNSDHRPVQVKLTVPAP